MKVIDFQPEHTYRCYWNGIPQGKFVVVEYEVLPSETPTWWINQHIGKIRQGLLLYFDTETFMIDNEHGDGFYKVTLGMGSPMVGHKSVDNYKIIKEVSQQEWKTEVNVNALKYEHNAHMEWLQVNHPEQYKRAIALQKAIDNFDKSKSSFNAE